jgi:hypothetical protein
MANTGPTFTTAGTTLTLKTLAAANVALFNDATNNTMVVTSVEFSDVSNESIETTGLEDTGARTFIRTLIYNPGTLAIGVQIDLDKLVTAALANAAYIDGDNYNLTIQFPIEQGSGDSTGPSVAGDGHMSNFSFGGAVGEAIEGSFTWKWSGALTWTASS